MSRVTLTGQQHSELLRSKDDFRRLLAKAAQERNDRAELIPTADGLEPEWVLYERDNMHAAVNRTRASNGLPPCDLAAVKRVETMACGHIDYALKFALYCAELAIDSTPKVDP